MPLLLTMSYFSVERLVKISNYKVFFLQMNKTLICGVQQGKQIPH